MFCPCPVCPWHTYYFLSPKKIKFKNALSFFLSVPGIHIRQNGLNFFIFIIYNMYADFGQK